MHHDANDSTVSALLSKKENFEISWHIAEWVEKEKKSVLQIYWSKVKEILDSRIREHSLSDKWGTLISEQTRGCGASLWLYPTTSRRCASDAAWDPPCFTIVIDNIFGEKDGCYYGIRCPGKSDAFKASIEAKSADVIEKLRPQEFVLFKYWFVVYKYARKNKALLDFDPISKRGMMELVDDKSSGHPRAHLFADLIWALFVDSQAAIEIWNADSKLVSLAIQS